MSSSRPLRGSRGLRFSLGRVLLIVIALVGGGVGICEAAILSQTDFENGRLMPWGTFVTPNGTMGGAEMPRVVPFESGGNRPQSQSLQFKVGQVRYDSDNAREQGGGLVMQITTETGTLNLSAHIAVTYHSPNDKRNLAGGLFQWVVDDHVMASHDMGPIENNEFLHHHLKAHHSVNAGVHTIRLRVTRPFTSYPKQDAPLQYIDDLLISFSPNP